MLAAGRLALDIVMSVFCITRWGSLAGRSLETSGSAQQPDFTREGTISGPSVSQIHGGFMSHVVTIETEVRDAVAVEAACQRLGLPQPIQGTTQLFSGQAVGLAVQLPGWHYPVVCQLESCHLKFDD